MRRFARVLIIPLAWYAMACVADGSGSGNDTSKASASQGRDLTTFSAETDAGAVVSDLELGGSSATPETPVTMALSRAPKEAGPASGAENEAPLPEPVVVSFAAGLNLAGAPRYIEAPLPVMGAGGGTMLRPGITVTSVGPAVQLFRSTKQGESPWPKAMTGQYPGADRSAVTLAAAGGGHGACVGPGGGLF